MRQPSSPREKRGTVKRRVLTVALAMLLAVLGTGGVLAYVRQADNRALAGQKAVSVLVAGKLIPSGTTAAAALRDGLLTSQKLPAAALPADAMSSIPPRMSALVLSADVQQGQLLLRPMLVTAAQVTSGLPIPAGMVAVTVSLCLPEAVAGYVKAGSEVEVFSTYGPKASTLTAQPYCTPPHEQQDYGDVHTRMVLPRVQVLSVGPAAASTSGASSMSGSSTSGSSAASSTDTLVTVAVSQASAGRLILLTETGLPYLALLTGPSQTSVDTRFVPPSGPLSGKRPSAKP